MILTWAPGLYFICYVRRVSVILSHSPGKCNVKFVEIDKAVENRVREAVCRWLEPSVPHTTCVDSRPPLPLSPAPSPPSCCCIDGQRRCHRQGQQEQERNEHFENVPRQHEDLDHVGPKYLRKGRKQLSCRCPVDSCPRILTTGSAVGLGGTTVADFGGPQIASLPNLAPMYVAP